MKHKLKIIIRHLNKVCNNNSSNNNKYNKKIKITIKIKFNSKNMIKKRADNLNNNLMKYSKIRYL